MSHDTHLMVPDNKIVYLDLADAINKFEFVVQVPSYYKPVQSDYFLKYNIEEFHKAGDFDMCIAHYPLAYLIDMHALDVPWDLYDSEHNMPIMIDILTAYMQEVQPKLQEIRANNKIVAGFIERLEAFLGFLKNYWAGKEGQMVTEGRRERPAELVALLARFV